MNIETELYETAISFIEKRYPTGWGGNVKIAVTNDKNILLFKSLRELQPYHWSTFNGKKL
ncbi:MAG: hypothetical protein COA74_10040 [Gammaproteobacteria bacterium]|nr:MAG: hypothetical protein COA74_10040 [Gammaproteobacteria bacterium]